MAERPPATDNVARGASGLAGYGLAVATTVAATVVAEVLRPVFVTIPTLPFTAAIALTAWRSGMAPALVALGLGTVSVTYFFLTPLYSLRVESFLTAAQIGGFVAVAGFIVWVIQSLRVARLVAETAVRDRDAFLATAAHELRTPVTTLKGSADLLLAVHARGTLTPERMVAGLRRISATSGRLAGLVEDLLDISRLRTGVPLRLQMIDLAALIRDAADEVGARLGERHRLTVATAEVPLVARVDPDRLKHVLLNLLDNAAKFSPAGGEIRVRAMADGIGTRLEVADEGIGLPTGAARSLFAPGSRATNATTAHLPGMGLGLAICHAIVTQHRGRITLASPGEGQGTVASVWLPTAGPPETETTGKRRA